MALGPPPAQPHLTPLQQAALAGAALPWLLHLRFRTPLAYALIQGVSMTLWLLAYAWGLSGR